MDAKRYLRLIWTALVMTGMAVGAFALGTKVGRQTVAAAPDPGLAYNAAAPLAIPSLQVIAAREDDPLRAAAMYYAERRMRLAHLFGEGNDTRLAALFAMYTVHLAHPYGPAQPPATFDDYLRQEQSHCGIQAWAQGQLAGALGLTWRHVVTTDMGHGWIEVQVNGRWEVFDSTTNVWLSAPAEDLLRGGTREYRVFYTPVEDAHHPEARAHLTQGYDVLRLRWRMVGLGLTWQPDVKVIEEGGAR